jgi:hypothetical protein
MALLFLQACTDEAVELLPSPSPTQSQDPTPLNTPEATSTAPSTATPSPLSGTPSAGFEAFRAFGRDIAAAIASSNAAFFADRGVEIDVVCRGDEQLGQCMNQPSGTVLRGIPGGAWRSDAGGVTARADFLKMVSDWFAAAIPTESDNHGDGSPRLIALAETQNGEFMAIASLIRDTGSPMGIQRQCRVFRFLPAEGDWELPGEYFCYSSAVSEDWLTGFCGQCYQSWESWTTQ